MGSRTRAPGSAIIVGSAKTTTFLPALERERILAARGWEEDADRRPFVRELIAAHVEGAYLWSYTRQRSQDRAVERTRAAILRAAHSLGRIPDGCSFRAWLFLELLQLHDTATRSILHSARSSMAVLPPEAHSSGCPEPWRVLCALEGRTSDSEVRAHVPGCGACRHLEEEYRAFILPDDDPVLAERSGWTKVESELACFLDGYFTDPATAPKGRPALGARMPLLRLSGSRLLAGGTAVVAAALVSFLALSQLREARGPRGDGSESKSVPTDGVTGGPPPSGPAGSRPARTVVQPPSGPRLGHFAATPPVIAGESIAFGWEDAGAETYRVAIYTPRLDTLFTAAATPSRELRIPVARLRTGPVESSFLFEVVGLRGGAPFTTTGYVPFTLAKTAP